MTNSEQAIRELADKWGFSQDKTNEGFLIDNDRTKQCLSDLTALISEHYVSREEYDEEKKSNSLLHKAMVTAEKGGHDKAMEEISEHYYPKEFVEWYLTESSNDRRRIYPYCYMIWVNGEGIGFDTFDELFNYWEENER